MGRCSSGLFVLTGKVFFSHFDFVSLQGNERTHPDGDFCKEQSGKEREEGEASQSASRRQIDREEEKVKDFLLSKIICPSAVVLLAVVILRIHVEPLLLSKTHIRFVRVEERSSKRVAPVNTF